MAMYIKGYNLIPFPYIASNGTTAGITYTKLADGSVKVVGTATALSYFALHVDWDHDMDGVFKTGKYYRLSHLGEGSAYIRLNVSTATSSMTTAITSRAGQETAEWKEDYTFKRLDIIVPKGATVDTVVKPMLVEGEEEKPYDNGKIQVKSVIPVRNPKNLIPFPYIVESGYTNSAGITITYDKYGTLTTSGTSTADTWVSTRMQSKFYLPLGEYTLVIPKTAPRETQVKIRRYAKAGNNLENIQAMPYTGIYSKDFSVTDETQYFTFELAFRAKTNYDGSLYVAIIKKGEQFDNPIAPKKFAIAQGVRNEENLIPFPYYSKPSNLSSAGIEVAINADGSVTFNGTATKDCSFVWYLGGWGADDGMELKAGHYTYYGVTSGSSKTYYSQAYVNGKAMQPTQAVSPVTITVNDGDHLNRFTMFIKTGAVFDNITIYPMLVEGETIKPYFVPQKI